jgi:hypothetical protein
VLFPVFLIAIDCQQYAGNDSDKKDASSPGRNMEADDCSKMENDMLAEIGNFYSCFSPGEKSSYVEDFSNTLEITDEYGEVGTLTNNGITQYDRDMSQIEYVNEGYCENAYVENDEAVARALQEEFTRIDSLEASGGSNVGEENMQASVLAQDWFGPSKRHYGTGNETLAAMVLTVVCFRVISCFSYCNRLPTIRRE